MGCAHRNKTIRGVKIRPEGKPPALRKDEKEGACLFRDQGQQERKFSRRLCADREGGGSVRGGRGLQIGRVPK